MIFNKNASTNSSNEEREVPAAKTCPARIIGIYDVGMQKGFNAEDPAKPQLVLTYELLGKEKMADGKPFLVSEFLTVSLHVKATLPKRLKVFGAPVKQKNEDWYDLADGYSLSDCLGEPCMVQVGHNTKGNAKILNVIEPIDGLTIGEAENPIGYLDLDADDYMDQLMVAPKWIHRRVEDQAV